MMLSMFSKHRLEALSDGIFAIVMTLLVLDLKVPEGLLPKHFGIMLAQQWVSFLITFTIAAIFWTLQHRVFDIIDDMHQKTLVPTFIFLGFVSVLPFSTSLLGHRLKEAVSFQVYYGNTFLIAAALLAKLLLAKHLGAVRESIQFQVLRMRLSSMCIVMMGGFIAAFFVPVRWTWIVAAGLGIAAKRIRANYATKLATA